MVKIQSHSVLCLNVIERKVYVTWFYSIFGHLTQCNLKIILNMILLIEFLRTWNTLWIFRFRPFFFLLLWILFLLTYNLHRVKCKYMLTNIWVVSRLRLLCTKLLWTSLHKSFYRHTFLFLLENTWAMGRCIFKFIFNLNIVAIQFFIGCISFRCTT